MSEMTPDKALALRKPFPPESVGQLPKPYKKESPKGNCNECGGYHGLPAVHLDYVGHAATTDRLLTVDPEWSWEPMGVDQYGLPMPDAQGNLWIKLTICGVTRIGVGDGSSMKERIGDALRNAAMRFGVALDLWAKEDLVEFEQAARSRAATPISDPAPAPASATTPVEPPTGVGSESPPQDEPMTPQTRGHLFALFGKKGVVEAEQLPGINAVTGQTYTSRADVTEADAKKVIGVLKKRPDATTEETA